MKVFNSFIKQSHLMVAVCLSLGITAVEVSKMSDWLEKEAFKNIKVI